MAVKLNWRSRALWAFEVLGKSAVTIKMLIEHIYTRDEEKLIDS